MKNIINFIKKIGSKNSANTQEPERIVHPKEIFLSVIKRETSRYNRNKRPFSVITLDISSYIINNNIAQLTRSLGDRIRISDDIGWLDENTLGLLLSETNRDGTKALVQSLLEGTNNGFSDIVMTVYHYPSSDWPDMFL